MKIIVTGGCGFIGSAVVKTLIDSKKNTIINTDNLTYASNKFSLKNLGKKDKYFFEKIDICDKKKVKKVFDKYNPDGIIHLAAETHVDRSIDSSLNFIKTNILGTHNLLELSREQFKKKNLDFFMFPPMRYMEIYKIKKMVLPKKIPMPHPHLTQPVKLVLII